MTGFPVRPSRTTFGPTLVNGGRVRDPTKNVGDDAFNLLFWQIAGMGVVSPRMLLKAVVDPSGAGSVVTSAQKMAWDSNGAVPATTWTYDSLGQYTWTLSAGSYPDKDGASVALGWLFAIAIPIGVGLGGSTPLLPFALVPAAQTGTVKMIQADDASSSDDPASFIVLAW